MVTAEYQVIAIIGDDFIVIYTRGSAMVKACLARFLRMFNSSTDEWVVGLDVEYTTVLGSEKNLKEADKKKPADPGLRAWLMLGLPHMPCRR